MSRVGSAGSRVFRVLFCVWTMADRRRKRSELRLNLSDKRKRAPISRNALRPLNIDTIWTRLAYSAYSASVSAAAARTWIRLYCLDFDP